MARPARVCSAVWFAAVYPQVLWADPGLTPAKLAAEGRPALVTYFMGGDPDYATSLSIMKALPWSRRPWWRA